MIPARANSDGMGGCSTSLLATLGCAVWARLARSGLACHPQQCDSSLMRMGCRPQGAPHPADPQQDEQGSVQSGAAAGAGAGAAG